MMWRCPTMNTHLSGGLIGGAERCIAPDNGIQRKKKQLTIPLKEDNQCVS